MATVAITAATNRVGLGATTRPAAYAVATHWSRQNGQTISSPTVCCSPMPRGLSSISPGPPSPSGSVNGDRRGAVTLSLAIVRLVLWLATPINARSRGAISSGRRRRKRHMNAPSAAAYAPARSPYGTRRARGSVGSAAPLGEPVHEVTCSCCDGGLISGRPPSSLPGVGRNLERCLGGVGCRLKGPRDRLGVVERSGATALAGGGSSGCRRRGGGTASRVLDAQS